MAQKTEIIIHCAATRPEWMAGQPGQAKVDEIRRWHVEGNGWNDIAYAEIIDRDGTRYAGRDLDGDGDTWEEIGAHTRGQNRHSIGVCLLGGHGASEHDQFSDHFTEAQERALLQFIEDVRKRYGDVKISGHNEYAAKACPGFQVQDWLTGTRRQPRTSIAQSRTIQASQVAKVAAAATPVAGLFADMPWQNLLILAALSAVVLIATGIIDIERLRKWRRGDK